MELPTIVTQLLSTLPLVDRQKFESICLAVQDLSIDSYSSFIWSVRLNGYGPQVALSVQEGKGEEGFYRYAHVCGNACFNVHPLMTAIRSENLLKIRCLFYSSYRILLKFCRCHKSTDLLKLLRDLSSRFPEFRQASPELEKYWQEADAVFMRLKQTTAHQSETFNTIIKRYYETGSDQDKWKVIELLGTSALKNHLHSILMPIFEDRHGLPNFEQLVKLLSRAQIDEIINGTDDNGILSYLMPYMTQAQKNSNLWDPFNCSLGILTNHVKADLDLQGDIYTSDSRGNPWIVCLMAGCHWGTFNHSNFLRGANCLALNVGRMNDNMLAYYSLAKPYDKWRIETHKYRCLRFRNRTKRFLLCVRRVIGLSLPKTCIASIMQRLVEHEVKETNFTALEPDEFDRICELKFTAYYLYGFNEGVTKLAISRGIQLTTTDKYLVAELLATQTCQEIAAENSGSSLSQSLQTISDLTRKFKREFTFDRVQRILEGMNVYPYKHSNRECDPIPIHELLAFHKLFGFKQAKEPLLKKPKQ